MKILIVDDENGKVVDISQVALDAGIKQDSIAVATTAATAMQLLKENYYDLLIVDLVLPLRVGENPDANGGVSLLKQAHRSEEIKAPEYILGLTVSEEALNASKSEFSDLLWSVELSGPSNGQWKFKLQQKIQHLVARENQREGLSIDGDIDCEVLFVCALLSPELDQLHKASGVQWTQVTFPSDPILYWKACLELDGRPIEAYSICLPQMGLVAAASGVSQATRTLRPNVVVMTGICAGRKGDCDLGDAIAASITWDYGSGKFVQSDDEVVFEPSPVHVLADARVQRAVSALIADNNKIEQFYLDCEGYRPSNVTKLHFGPMASGAAVQNHKEFFNGVANQNRKILGVDMEAFGVAWACHQSFEPQPKWLIVKGVSDFADGTKDNDIQSFASFFSAKVGLEALRSLL